MLSAATLQKLIDYRTIKHPRVLRHNACVPQFDVSIRCGDVGVALRDMQIAARWKGFVRMWDVMRAKGASA
jgi:hypothetical protein